MAVTLVSAELSATELVAPKLVSVDITPSRPPIVDDCIEFCPKDSDGMQTADGDIFCVR